MPWKKYLRTNDVGLGRIDHRRLGAYDLAMDESESLSERRSVVRAARRVENYKAGRIDLHVASWTWTEAREGGQIVKYFIIMIFNILCLKTLVTSMMFYLNFFYLPPTGESSGSFCNQQMRWDLKRFPLRLFVNRFSFWDYTHGNSFGWISFQSTLHFGWWRM